MHVGEGAADHCFKYRWVIWIERNIFKLIKSNVYLLTHEIALYKVAYKHLNTGKGCEMIFEQCVHQWVPNIINVYFWKKSNYPILAHILYLFKECRSAHNSIYFQATLQSTILTLHNCYEIRAFILSRTTLQQYFDISTKSFCWELFLFQISIYET